MMENPCRSRRFLPPARCTTASCRRRCASSSAARRSRPSRSRRSRPTAAWRSSRRTIRPSSRFDGSDRGTCCTSRPSAPSRRTRSSWRARSARCWPPATARSSIRSRCWSAATCFAAPSKIGTSARFSTPRRTATWRTRARTWWRRRSRCCAWPRSRATRTGRSPQGCSSSTRRTIRYGRGGSRRSRRTNTRRP